MVNTGMGTLHGMAGKGGGDCHVEATGSGGVASSIGRSKWEWEYAQKVGQMVESHRSGSRHAAHAQNLLTGFSRGGIVYGIVCSSSLQSSSMPPAGR